MSTRMIPEREVIVVAGEYANEKLDILSRATSPELSIVQTKDLQSNNVHPDNVVGIINCDASTDPTYWPNLRWAHIATAGVDHILNSQEIPNDVAVTSSVGNGAVALAEHALLLALMCSRNAQRWFRAQTEHRWERYTHGELAGATMGIMGLGNCGSDLALKAKSCHMHTVGLARTPHPNGVAGVDEILPPQSLHELCSRSDFVAVTAPLTAETKSSFTSDMFRAMKSTAYLINVSRGAIVDESDLIDAIRQRDIAGAGLDAHVTEPIPSRSPLWDLPNVIITPHNGATTAQTAERSFAILLENLRRFSAGYTLLNLVDRDAGY